MKSQQHETKQADLSSTATDGVIKDKLTGYPVQLWSQEGVLAWQPRYMVLYLRQGKWHKGSEQMLNRVLRAFGLIETKGEPWGAGKEVVEALDDMIASSKAAPNAPIGACAPKNVGG